MEYSITITEDQRQLMLLALALTSLSRPGFDYALREIAKRLPALHNCGMPQRPQQYRPDRAIVGEQHTPAQQPANQMPRSVQPRPSAAARGYGRRWRAARAAYLQLHPLCAECERHGIVTVATDVDHVVPHKGDRELFWDETKWQGLCESCHSAKTAREDGGFGNRRKAKKR